MFGFCPNKTLMRYFSTAPSNTFQEIEGVERYLRSFFSKNGAKFANFGTEHTQVGVGLLVASLPKFTPR